MKYKYVYTVTREYDDGDSLEEEKEFFLGVQDEAGEYLYGGSKKKKKIKVHLEYFENGEWKRVE